MKKLLAKKYIPFLLLAFFAFRAVFEKIECYYMIDPNEKTRHPIDVHSFECKVAFDWQYVKSAKETMYKRDHYVKSFLPLDLIFPFVYSWLFLCCLLYCTNLPLRKIFTVLIAAGALFDLAEDTSFTFYLYSNGDSLAHAVSFFTTIKTVLISANIIIALYYMSKAFK